MTERKLPTLEQMVEAGVQHARRCLIKERQKNLMGFYHLICRGSEDAIIPLLWGNEIQKKIALAGIRDIAKKMDAVIAMAITEAWTVAAPEHLRDKVKEAQAWMDRQDPPSQHPHRQESVIVFATDGERNIGKMLHMRRDKPGGRITDLVEDEVSVGKVIDGRMADILPRRGSNG